MAPENRQNCAYATEPLLEAVENLVTYASSPEFASVPAKISPQVCSFCSTYLCFVQFNIITLEQIIQKELR